MIKRWWRRKWEKRIIIGKVQILQEEQNENERSRAIYTPLDNIVINKLRGCIPSYTSQIGGEEKWEKWMEWDGMDPIIYHSIPLIFKISKQWNHIPYYSIPSNSINPNRALRNAIDGTKPCSAEGHKDLS